MSFRTAPATTRTDEAILRRQKVITAKYIDDEGNVQECDIINNGVRFVLNDGNAEVQYGNRQYLIKTPTAASRAKYKNRQKPWNADGEMTLRV